jgi:hypothetical protein
MAAAVSRYIAARYRLTAEALCHRPGDETIYNVMVNRADLAERDAKTLEEYAVQPVILSLSACPEGCASTPCPHVLAPTPGAP